MAPKRKSKSKKEVLPDPQTVPSGRPTYYISDWSLYQSIKDVSEISTDIVAACTAEDRTVEPIPRMDVLLLPCAIEDVEGYHENEETDMVDIVVADQMHVEGISRKFTAERMKLEKDWKQEIPPEPEEEPEPEKKEKKEKKGKKGKKGRTPSETPEPQEKEEEVVEDAGEAAEGAEATPGEEGAAAEAAAAAGGEEELPAMPEEVPEMQANPLDGTPVFFGSDFSAMDVELNGNIRVLGVQPQIVVKPVLPEPPKREEPDDKKKKGAKGKKGGKKGRRKSAVKLTPEQIAEIEQKRIEEEELFLKKTEEAIARAAEEEEYLMTFAHPNKWANVVVSNVTFTGPVAVTRAHVTFMNCRFTSKRADKPQLTISQYCRVVCTKCTFDEPQLCGLYALPAAQVTVKKCLFSGVAQVDLHGFESSASAAAKKAADAKGPAPADDSGEEDEVDGGEQQEDGDDDNEDTDKVVSSGEVTMTADLEARYARVRENCPAAVGIHGDCAKLIVDTCRFLFLGIGTFFQGTYAFEPRLDQRRGEAKKSAHMSVVSTYMYHVFNTAISIDAANVLVKKNRIADCGYYGLDCRSGRCHDTSIYHNRFGIQAQVRIRCGAQVQLMHNELQNIPIDDNKRENPCIQPVY